MIASAKEIDALNITLFNSCINFTNVHLCNYCTKIFVIVVNTCVCRRSVDNKALILSYPVICLLSRLHPPRCHTGTQEKAFLITNSNTFLLVNVKVRMCQNVACQAMHQPQVYDLGVHTVVGFVFSCGC